MIDVEFKALTPTARVPAKGSIEAACFDLYADSVKFTRDGPDVGTGLAIAPPPGYALLIYPRSGLSSTLGLNLRNTVGIVDSDYRGELVIKFTPGYEHTRQAIVEALTSHGRVAQCMLIPIPQVNWVATQNLRESIRDEGGFGSTGLHSPIKQYKDSSGRVHYTTQGEDPGPPVAHYPM